jgi:hypothetical protein
MSLYLEIPVFSTCVPGASGCHLAHCISTGFLISASRMVDVPICRLHFDKTYNGFF